MSKDSKARSSVNKKAEEIKDPVPENVMQYFHCDYCDEDGIWNDALECYTLRECGCAC